jgi:pyridoxamine 5'-phosphate oxidase
VPDRVEFWQGRTSRLHDRLVFHREPAGQGGNAADGSGDSASGSNWRVERLQP